MKNLQKLLAQREAVKTLLTDFIKQLEAARDNEDWDAFNTIYETIEGKVSQLVNLNEDIFHQSDAQGVQEDQETGEAFLLQIKIKFSRFREYKDKQERSIHVHRDIVHTPGHPVSTFPTDPSAHTSLSTAHGSCISSASSQYQLPKLSLPKFDGDVLQWQTFWDAFESSVHQNHALSDVQRFNYLKSQLEGDAARTLEGFALTNANYARAVDLLKDRFGQEQKIIHATMQALLNLQAPSHSIQSLRHFSDKIEAFVRGLESLGQLQESYGTLLVPVILDKLPADIRKNLARINKQQTWNLDELRVAVNDEIRILEAGDSGHLPDVDRKSTVSFFTGTNSKLKSRTFATRQGVSVKCQLCDESHSATKCTKYVQVDQRLFVVKQKHLCYNCLGKHQVAMCRSTKRCLICHKKHHTSICKDSAIGQQVQGQQTTPAATTTQPGTAVLHSSSRQQNSAVLLKTATATVSSGHVSTDANILFDEGAQRSFITRALADELDLPSTGRETINLSSFGTHSDKTMTLDTAEVHLVTDTREVISIHVLVVPTIATPINNSVMDHVSNLPYLRGLKLAHAVTESGMFTVTMLIGADYYWKVVEDRVIRGDGPTAVKSKLGYLLSGPMPANCSQTTHHIMNVLTCRQPDVHALERFWEIESAGTTPELPEKSDSEYFEHYQTHSIDFENGRYVAKLPWKAECPELPSNHDIALRRTESTIRRLSRDPAILAKYGEIIEEQERRGFIEKVPESEEKPQRVHYIPHHPVKKDSSTTPVRIVYDCSCRQSYDHLSLNDCLETRPPQLNDITSLLARFRLHEKAVTTDIEKAFLHVGLHPQDRDVTRFFWLSDPNDPDSPLITYRFRVVLFGATCSPFILNATLLKHLRKHAGTETANVLERDLYVDNVISSFDQTDELLRYFDESRNMLSAAGMNLRSWASNEEYLRNRAADENVLDNDDVTKVLGLRWEPASDTMSFVNRDLPELQTVTKRDILKFSSQIYDPLGLLSPVTVRAKLLMQELWKEKQDWDVPLSAAYQLRWNLLARDLNQATELKFQRQYFEPKTDKNSSSVHLHVFVDASVKSYGAAVYVCNAQQSNLVMAKNRVAPLKKLTIPQLELMAAVIGARLAKHVQSALPVKTDVTFWSDSQIVLHWLSSTKTLKTFIRKRVSEIKQLTASYQWRYCPTNTNPADLLTRGITADAFMDNSLWKKGPAWLTLRKQWPESNVTFPTVVPLDEQTTESGAQTISETDSTQQSTQVANLQCVTNRVQRDVGDVIDVNRYSKLAKLLRVTAYVLRFIKNCRSQNSERLLGPLSARELEIAQNEWIKSCQNSAYAREIAELKTHSVRSSIVKQLRLYLDGKEMLRCAGRIHNASLGETTKFPYLLPNKHPYTRLLVKSVHERKLHTGPESTITHIREKYWIPCIRQCVQSVIRKCVVCRKVTGQPYAVPDPPPLPKDRVQDSPPFTVTGVDFTGALYVREKNGGESKAYVCLFTCAATRAVHLELVPDLTAETFLQAFRRFCSRKSTPRIMISDNATTYNAAADILKRLFKSSEIKEALSTDGIDWKFIPKRAPWYGGWWERLIGLTKQTLKKVLGRSYVSYLTLQTLLTEVEAILNDRPLTYVSSDIADAEALTPAHLLYGRRVTALPEADVTTEALYTDAGNEAHVKKQARLLHKLISHFRERWRREYLTALREHHRASGNNEQTISVGDVVQVHEEVPRSRWKLAVIKELTTGGDGHSRSAIIKTKSGITNRPIAKLYPLEVI